MTELAADPRAAAALEAWEDDALVELSLTNGRRVKVAPSSTAVLLTTGLLPQPLVDAVLAKTDGGQPISDPQLGLALVTKAQEHTAAAIRYVWHGDEWVRIVVDVQTYGRLPAADRRSIARVALGEELGEVADDALASFRDDGPPGNPAGSDGGPVQSATESPDGNNRATRRARRRSGAAPAAARARAR